MKKIALALTTSLTLLACARGLPEASFRHRDICDDDVDSLFVVCSGMSAMCPPAENVAFNMEAKLVSIYFGEYQNTRYVLSVPYNQCRFMLMEKY